MIIKHPATHQTHRYSTSCNANISKLAKCERNILFNNKFKLKNLNLLIKFVSQSIFKNVPWLEVRHGDACAACQ